MAKNNRLNVNHQKKIFSPICGEQHFENKITQKEQALKQAWKCLEHQQFQLRLRRFEQNNNYYSAKSTRDNYHSLTLTHLAEVTTQLLNL